MTYLIVGLGNPGDKYIRSRHNAGFLLLDYIYGKEDWNKCTTCNLLYKNTEDALCIKPLTMMNLSGRAVLCRKEKHDIDIQNIIVVHDDVDLRFGEFKISKASSDGGHNGIKSIIESLGTKEFIRVRIGIAPTTLFGLKKKPRDTSAFVLKDFTNKQLRASEDMKDDIASILRMIQSDGVERAMNRFN